MRQAIWNEIILVMSRQMIDKIEYLVLLVAEFAARSKVSESTAYRYLSKYGL